ncbi:MAG: hypothetical protein RLZZ324_951, partial [Candidatus Parcubacteria bacterium]
MPIYHVTFPTRYLLAATMMRFQEHYESPHFRGRVFDNETVMDRYAAERGQMSYFTDVAGCNLPASILKPFRAGDFDPLSRKERKFLRLLKDAPPESYVIATAGIAADPRALTHEIMHALFHAHSDYAADVRRVLRGKRLPTFRDRLRRIGYHASVMEDEANAYLTTGLTEHMREVDVRGVRAARKELLALARERFGADPSTRE